MCKVYLRMPSLLSNGNLSAQCNEKRNEEKTCRRMFIQRKFFAVNYNVTYLLFKFKIFLVHKFTLEYTFFFSLERCCSNKETKFPRHCADICIPPNHFWIMFKMKRNVLHSVLQMFFFLYIYIIYTYIEKNVLK